MTLLAIQAIDAAAAPHQHGHSCTDQRWYNANTGTRTPCKTWLHLQTARTAVARLAARPHESIHDPAVTEAVAAAMVTTPLEELDPEQREGWVQVAQLGLEEFCRLLDQDSDREGVSS